MNANLTTNGVTILLACVASLVAGPSYLAVQIPVEEDRLGIYRQQPTDRDGQLFPVPRGEVKPGLAYNYYNERLARRAWGLAREDGTFEYAFGEGSIMPADRFDDGLSPEEEANILQQPSDEFWQSESITGRSQGVIMTADGQWKRITFRVSPRVFDVESGHRWEWHGDRRVGVVHTYGDRWQVVDGRYRPLGGTLHLAIAPDSCHLLPRVGSAAYLIRTPEPAR